MFKNMGKNQSLKTPYPLILASTSKYRGALLSQLGWEFEAVAPGVDEDKVKAQGLTPENLAQELSLMKAKAVYVRNEGTCVIGSDQVCHLEGMILGKPHTHERAIEQLMLMQGKTHELLTAVTVITPKRIETFLNKTTLQMRKLTREEIISYVEFDVPLDCAGSYKLESRGIKLFEKIETTDQTSIIGLPLIQLTNVLLDIGFPF